MAITYLRNKYGKREQVFLVHQEIGDQQIDGLYLGGSGVRFGRIHHVVFQSGDHLFSDLRP